MKWLLIVLTIACLVVFLSFSSTGPAENESDGTSTYHVNIGLSTSPWLVIERRTSADGTPEANSFHVHVASLSWLFLAGFFGCLLLRRNLSINNATQSNPHPA